MKITEFKNLLNEKFDFLEINIGELYNNLEVKPPKSYEFNMSNITEGYIKEDDIFEIFLINSSKDGTLCIPIKTYKNPFIVISLKKDIVANIFTHGFISVPKQFEKIKD